MFNRNTETENFADTTQLQELDVMVPEQSLQNSSQSQTVNENQTANQEQQIVFPTKLDQGNAKPVDQNPSLDVMVPETAVTQNASGLEQISTTNTANNNEGIVFPSKLDNMTPKENPLQRLDRIRIRPDLNALDNRPQPAPLTELVAAKTIQAPNRDQILGRDPKYQLQSSNSAAAMANIAKLEQEFAQNQTAIQKIANATSINLEALKQNDEENQRRMAQLEQLRAKQIQDTEARKQFMQQIEMNRKNRGEGLGSLNTVKIIESNVQNNSTTTQAVQPKNTNLESPSQPQQDVQIMVPEQAIQPAPKKERFIIFGDNQEEELKYQLLLSRILNLGMLSMFTDLTDQETTISLLLVLKQIEQIAGKDLFKVIFKIENPKYATGAIFYGAEFAVEGSQGTTANEIDFISFGKSVLLRNVLNLLSLDKKFKDNLGRLDFLNQNRDAQGRDFSGQSKAAMVEFIQTILTITGNAQSPQPNQVQQEEQKVVQELNQAQSEEGLEAVPVEVDNSNNIQLEEMPEEQKVIEDKNPELIGSNWKDDMEFGG